MRPLVDQDYVERLSPEDAAFLDKFNEEYYGASFTEDPLHKNVEARREIYRTKARRNIDIYGRGIALTQPPDASTVMLSPEKDWTPRPEDGDEYRDALSHFRSVLPADGRKKVALTPRFNAARRKMDAAAGINTRELSEGRMAKSRLERLKAKRRVIFHLGVTVTQHQFKGEEAEAAVEMLRYLEAVLSDTDKKLEALGVDPKSLNAAASPPPKAGR